MKRFLIVAILALGLASPAMAQEFPTGVAEPWSYDPEATGSIVAEWNDAGEILILQKNAPTPTNSAAGAELLNVSGSELSSLSFDVKGYCNNGAPRFNVYWGDSWDNFTTGFFGCARSLDTAPTEDGWTNVNFVCNSGIGVPEEATGCGENVLAIEIVQDEEGQTDLRNITFNGQLFLPGVDVPEETVTSQQNRAGYCMPAPVLRADGTTGRFVDLYVGQPSFDSRFRGATPALFLEGRGISCELLPGYVQSNRTVDGFYPYYIKVVGA